MVWEPDIMYAMLVKPVKCSVTGCAPYNGFLNSIRKTLIHSIMIAPLLNLDIILNGPKIATN